MVLVRKPCSKSQSRKRSLEIRVHPNDPPRHGNTPLQNQPGDQAAGRDRSADAARIRQAVEGVLRRVLPGLYAESAGEGSETAKGIESQITAASLGQKPLYFDPWGAEAQAVASGLKRHLPAGTSVRAKNGILYVWRAEAVKPLLDADPAFYRPNQETDFEAIVRVSETGMNGELLGYGARHILHRPGVRVIIFGPGHTPAVGFVTTPEDMMSIVTARLADLVQATGRKDWEIEIEDLP
jgi:hypothetical protein